MSSVFYRNHRLDSYKYDRTPSHLSCYAKQSMNNGFRNIWGITKELCTKNGKMRKVCIAEFVQRCIWRFKEFYVNENEFASYTISTLFQCKLYI
ncbi:hypothetical protein C922_03722 [Plasmodium inui San Antonio 1]|uniref:Uncharacterized protein n=1 Tax=Plasmodium inui San Antonio 1 TaxID=1237626 RepID=W7A2T4_9APIC|nr:hypothetical protein C922_03722 [Plasmodium inui San Antonio 1]EUD65995.1 hypothetical protein C922_03722 [Plasmodium inui San Antonio 1]